MFRRLRPALAPLLLIGVVYVDPGKWAAMIEGGARFGSHFILPLVFSFAAVLCQYLSARITVVTGSDLSEICSEEYDKATCIFLGVLTEFSTIALDLAMVLGTAHGLNLVFGADLFTCVFLTTIDAVLYPVLATVLDNGKAKVLCKLMACFVLLFYAIGVLLSQPEISLSTTGMLTKLSGESAFALMGLLGANIMPHNFYLHSSLVKQELGPSNVSKGLLCHDHLFATLCIFSFIGLLNYVLMSAAANVFYNPGPSGLVLLTFPEALDQVFRSSIVPFMLLLVLLVSSQTTALTCSITRQAVLHDFFGMDIPGWLHQATVRIIAIIPALCCVWNLGAEGIYQLLIFTQVIVALMVPPAVIPLFRIASSRSVMGVYKISQFVEFLALIIFIGILGLKVTFLVEMVFGNSDWVSNLRWNVEGSMSVLYNVLLITASSSLGLMLWLLAIPLKSASSRLEAQEWNWDVKDAVPESTAERDETDTNVISYSMVEPRQKEEPALAPGMSLESHSDKLITSVDVNLPETLLDSNMMTNLTTIEENGSKITSPTPFLLHAEKPASTVGNVVESTVCSDDSVGKLLNMNSLNTESTNITEKTVRVEGDIRIGKNEDVDICEPEESFKGATDSSPSLTSDGPGSYRSLVVKNEDSGSGAGSLSRLAGLGRAGRRQLAAVLDEFWGQLFDFHGQATQEAKSKKLDILLGVDTKVDPKATTPLKVDTNVKEFPGYLPSGSGLGSNSPMHSTVYDSSKLLGVQGSTNSYVVQRVPSSSWSSRMQLLEPHAQSSSQNAVDSAERRYSSLRLPPSSGGNDPQPITIHGYQIASYLNRSAKERSSDYLNGQMEAVTRISPSASALSYRDPPGFASGRKLQNGLSPMKPPGFENSVVSRNISLQSGRTVNDLYSAGPAENLNSAVNSKKFHSLPDISGLSIPYRDLSDRSSQRDNPMGYESSLYSHTSLKAGSSLAFDNLSPSKPYRDPLTSQFRSSSGAGSLWSRQPFEQFGVADKTYNIGGAGVEPKQGSLIPEATSVVDMEAKLLQSFRLCIVKLLKLEGSDWLFRQNDGADEDLIDRVAAREKFLYEAETREMNQVVHLVESQYSFDRKPGSVLKNDETDYAKFLISSVPHCGEGCVWRVDLIVSFGVWCIHRVLELSLMESRPELWGKYTYVLNRLQGVIDLAFSKPRTPRPPCFCLQIPVAQQQRSTQPISNASLPPPAKQGSKGKCTTAPMLLDVIKDVEMAISCRKGRTGTAAGDVAFPKGKENLASVLKRYKRRLSNKPVGTHEAGSGSRKVPTSGPYSS